MPMAAELQIKVSKVIYDHLGFNTAIKDQAGIVEDLANGKDVSERPQAGFFDEYFFLLECLEFVSFFMALDSKLSSRPTINTFSRGYPHRDILLKYGALLEKVASVIQNPKIRTPDLPPLVSTFHTRSSASCLQALCTFTGVTTISHHFTLLVWSCALGKCSCG